METWSDVRRVHTHSTSSLRSCNVFARIWSSWLNIFSFFTSIPRPLVTLIPSIYFSCNIPDHVSISHLVCSLRGIFVIGSELTRTALYILYSRYNMQGVMTAATFVSSNGLFLCSSGIPTYADRTIQTAVSFRFCLHWADQADHRE